jgi:hypothetical protein
MTYNEWKKDPKNATALAELLNQPIMQEALSLLESQTMAKTIGSGPSLLQSATNSHVLFGWDCGRASAWSDLSNLALVQSDDELAPIVPTYQGEF